jgi:predicted ArsR family transcriptional regulator
LRLAAYEFLRFDCSQYTATTLEVAKALQLSTTAARRTLEDLAAYGVVRRLPKSETGSRSDQWITGKCGLPPEDED